MIYVALAEAVVIAVVAIAFSHVLRSVIRSAARERDLLLNQVCHLAGRTWQEPPSAERFDIPEMEQAFLLSTPEQLPDY